MQHHCNIRTSDIWFLRHCTLMPWKFYSGLSESRIHSPRCIIFQLLWSVNMHLDSITAVTVTYQMSKWLEGHNMRTHSLEPLWHFTITVCLTTWPGFLSLEISHNLPWAFWMTSKPTWNHYLEEYGRRLVKIIISTACWGLNTTPLHC